MLYLCYWLNWINLETFETPMSKFFGLTDKNCCISDALTNVTIILDIPSVSNFSIYEISKIWMGWYKFFLFKWDTTTV